MKPITSKLYPSTCQCYREMHNGSVLGPQQAVVKVVVPMINHTALHNEIRLDLDSTVASNVTTASHVHSTAATISIRPAGLSSSKVSTVTDTAAAALLKASTVALPQANVLQAQADPKDPDHDQAQNSSSDS